MSRPLLVVFALLLVLRAWVGDAMAMQLPAAGHCPSAPAVVQAAEGHAAHHGRAGHGDMHGAAPAVAHGGSAHCGDADAGHASCGDCQVCHTAALPFGTGGPAPAAVPQALPRAVSGTYASADPAPGFKPPIPRSSRP